MTDRFALFGEVRRPWLDAEQLKARFLELSAQWHPDHLNSLPSAERAAAEERYVELNTAYQCLRDPRERLRHLLQLEGSSHPGDIRQAPDELVSDFLKVGQLCRESDALLRTKHATTSPLLKVQVFAQCHDLGEQLRLCAGGISDRRDALLQTLQQADAEWANAPDPETRQTQLTKLEAILHRLAFYDRWIAQLLDKATQVIL